MEPKQLNERPQARYQEDTEILDRRYEDRRKENCNGYTYISMVGWICRREKNRRKLKPAGNIHW
jgi:hypothetical protein